MELRTYLDRIVIAFALLWVACGTQEPAEETSGTVGASSVTAQNCLEFRLLLQEITLPVAECEFWEQFGQAGEPDGGLKSLSCFSGYCTISTYFRDFSQDCSFSFVREGWEDQDEFMVTDARLSARDENESPGN